MNQSTNRQITGMTGFIIIWIGQVVSVLASGMSHFALSLWMYEQARSATAMALMQVFFITPFLIMSIPAGVMIDPTFRTPMGQKNSIFAPVVPANE